MSKSEDNNITLGWTSGEDMCRSLSMQGAKRTSELRTPRGTEVIKWTVNNELEQQWLPKLPEAGREDSNSQRWHTNINT